MIHKIVALINIKEVIILGISLSSIPIVPLLGALAAVTTIIYNAIRIYKEIKNRKHDN